MLVDSTSISSTRHELEQDVLQFLLELFSCLRSAHARGLLEGLGNGRYIAITTWAGAFSHLVVRHLFSYIVKILRENNNN